MTLAAPPRLALRKGLVLLLAAAAGASDAASFAGLGRVFTANMTGNTVLLGLSLVEADWAGAGRSGLSLACFAAGVALGACLARRASAESVWPSVVTVVLVVEWLVLAVLFAGWLVLGPVLALVALAALAMGMQSAAVRRLDVAGVATTYLTGTLTTLVASLVDPAKDSGHARHGPALLAAVWLVYLAGVVVAAAILMIGGPLAVVVPLGLLVTVIVTAAVWLPGDGSSQDQGTP